MNVRAMFIDMDGTLLNRSNDISHRNIEAIYRLSEQGVLVFLATGRHYEVTAPYHKQLGLETPMICLNGAAILDGKTGNIIEKKTVHINEEIFHDIITKIPCVAMVHSSNGLYCNRTNEEIDYWTNVGNTPPRYIGDLKKANYDDVLKYSVRTGRQSPELSILFKKEAEVIDWDDGFEIIAPQTSKWSAIESILATYQINPHEVVAIGDGPNDIEMLRHAGCGVAMGNANNMLKETADVVTGHNENDGLAQFIEHYLLQTYAM